MGNTLTRVTITEEKINKTLVIRDLINQKVLDFLLVCLNTQEIVFLLSVS